MLFFKKMFNRNKECCTCMDEDDTSCEITEPMEKKINEFEEFLNCDVSRIALPKYETPYSEDEAAEMFLPSFEIQLKDNQIPKKVL